MGLGQDLRLAVRTLRATPVVTAVAVLSLALGIGATTAIFIVNSLMLRGLPVAEPERLVTITSETPLSQGRTPGWTNPIWLEVRQRASLFDGALAWSQTLGFNLSQTGEVDRVDGVYASGEFFETLGVSAAVGRTFTTADDVRGGGADGVVAVISHRLWQLRFGGAPSVIGAPIVSR